MAVKFVSPENLDRFKDNQDAANDLEFAKKTELPTSVSELTNDKGYVTSTDLDVKIAQALQTVFRYKGVKATLAELLAVPAESCVTGDVWQVSENEGEYAWNGVKWEPFGIPVILSWDAISGKPEAFVPEAHTHTVSEIADFPTSMPASDVADWAKQPTKPAYTYDEVGAAPASHAHATMGGATASAAGTAGFVPAPAAGAQARFLRGDGSWEVPPDNDTVYDLATATSAGLMSAADKAKLDDVDLMEPMTEAEVDALFED